jgi:phosphate transport system substrate-binding protein
MLKLIASGAAVLVVIVLIVVAAGCGDSASTAGTGADGSKPVPSANLTGAGATFPYPLYSKWFDVFGKENPQVTINYQSIGSGGGIQQITAQTVDFGGTDAPMKDDELAKAPGQLIHIPTVAGAVVVVYNVNGVSSGLKLTPDTLAKIFMGSINKWNDPALMADKESLNLPDKDIIVVHRSDGSGTTSIFTDYLNAANAEWKDKVGKGKEVKWPVGLGAKGNEGVGGQVSQTDGSIGYVELAYATQNKLTTASLKNKAGKFVDASVESTTAAVAGAAGKLPDDLRGSIVNAEGDTAYPIAGLTYLLVYKEQTDADKGEALVDFISWAVHDGGSYAKDLEYAPLPPEIVSKVDAKLKQITANGKSLAS